MSGGLNIMEVTIVINEETTRKLREMKLGDMVTALEMQHRDLELSMLPFVERFQRIVDFVYQERYNQKTQRLIKLAKLRLPKADMNSILYAGRNLDKDKLLELFTCHFMGASQNLG